MRWPKVERMYATPPKDWPYEICGSPGFINHHYSTCIKQIISGNSLNQLGATNDDPCWQHVLMVNRSISSHSCNQACSTCDTVHPLCQIGQCNHWAVSCASGRYNAIIWHLYTCLRSGPWWSLLCSRPWLCAHQHFHSQSSDSWES